VVATNRRPSAANAMPSGTWLSGSWQNVTGFPPESRRTRCRIDSVPYSRGRASKAMPFGVDARELGRHLARAGRAHYVQEKSSRIFPNFPGLAR
jgi:hypothetical protein